MSRWRSQYRRYPSRISLSASSAANRVMFMDKGEIVEQAAPNDFFGNPQNDRTRLFLSQILH
ncbi:hypothetical protein B1219_05845 [Pseudomonas ogarae]|nr:hypothetical protein B1219_05845 [Pseudomonas ogarae]OPG80349.1 hypothetical protein B1218_05595 [Pseudomonas ogarae]